MQLGILGRTNLYVCRVRVKLCTVMRRIKTFRSTTNRIFDGGPITL